MRIRTKTLSNKLSITLLAVTTLLFQSFAPFLISTSANAEEGYTTIICIMGDQQSVFVPLLGTNVNDSSENTSCYECQNCLVSNTASSWAPTTTASILSPDYKKTPNQLGVTAFKFNPALLYHYLSTGPPA